MKKKLRVMKQPEEAKRAHDTLLAGTCFVTKELLNNKEYDLVWHAGAQSMVFVGKNYTTSKKETLNEQGD
jgi:hypothetical protein